MLFILFDIDVVFLIPWVLTHRDLVAAGVPVLGPMMFFTFVLVIGLVYELKSGALKLGEINYLLRFLKTGKFTTFILSKK